VWSFATTMADEVYEAFSVYDDDRDGIITGREYKHVLRSLGQNPTDQEIDASMAEMDEDGKPGISFDEFAAGYARKQAPSDTAEDLRDAFKFFDKNSDGTVSYDELYQVMAGLNGSSEQEVQEMITEADKDGDSAVGFHEFQTMMSQQRRLSLSFTDAIQIEKGLLHAESVANATLAMNHTDAEMPQQKWRAVTHAFKFARRSGAAGYLPAGTTSPMNVGIASLLMIGSVLLGRSMCSRRSPRLPTPELAPLTEAPDA